MRGLEQLKRFGNNKEGAGDDDQIFRLCSRSGQSQRLLNGSGFSDSVPPFEGSEQLLKTIW